MPWRAYSTAISRVIASTPPLLAVYAICEVAAPTTATNDAVLMIEPPPASSMAGMPYLQPRNTPLRFTLMTCSQTSSEVSGGEPSASGKIPALLNRMWSPPWLRATSIAASISFADDTSARTKTACPPAAVICETVSSPPVVSMSQTTTVAPAPDIKSAASRPMPLPAPVIKAVRPASSPALSATGVPYSLDAFKVSRAFEIGDRLVEQRLLVAGEVQ